MIFKLTKTASTIDIDDQCFFASLSSCCSKEQFTADDLRSISEKGVEDLRSLIMERYCDQLDALIEEQFPTGEPRGQFVFSEVETSFVETTKENIRSAYGDAVVIFEAIDEEQHFSYSKTILLVEMLLERFELITCDSSFYGMIGRYIESCLEMFVRESRWHTGYSVLDDSIAHTVEADLSCKLPEQSIPLAWYGPENMPPQSKWTIPLNKAISPIWSTYESWPITEYLVEGCSESFLIWYTAELCLWSPDMEAIHSQCPFL